ncbi:hypothetical protein SAMN05421823_101355 [Catalinimonas alkaloidigena]|uniref:Uncharacterized protein n=2 Tax=Catalinimonas alkaloidigena TaxID=1075417 RepID=A0A1G8XGC6_9BACT|nr:hypothetical protein SAMN05421823_101355 [Catalinimonas alkaloidigena]
MPHQDVSFQVTFQQKIRHLKEQIRTIRRRAVPIFVHRRRDVLLQELHTLQRYPLPASHPALHRLYWDVAGTPQPTGRDWQRWQTEFVPLLEHLFAVTSEQLQELERETPPAPTLEPVLV